MDIHNGQSERFANVDPTVINSNNDLPPQFVREELAREIRIANESWLLIRNGDFQTVYLPFYTVMNQLTQYLRANAIHIPMQSLKGRAEFLAFQIRTIRDLYGMSVDLLPSIGGNVAVMTITDEGIQSYFNPYDTTI